MPLSKGTSLFQQAFLKKDQSVVAQITSLVDSAEVEVEWTSPDFGPSDVLRKSVDSNSTNNVRDAGRLICAGPVSFLSAAAIMGRCFKDILMHYQEVGHSALNRDLVIVEACCLRVHVDYMNQRLQDDTALHIGTSDSFLEWRLDEDQECLARRWRDKNAKAVEGMESKGNTSTRLAKVVYVCIEDAAKVGMKGVIRPLLLQKAPADVFKTKAIKAVIDYKWHKIWRNRFLKSAATYAVFLCTFALYAIFLSVSAELSDASTIHKASVTILCFLCFAFGALQAMEETSQIRTFLQDETEYFLRRSWGWQHLYQSRWNLVDVCSCALLLLVIPILHCAAIASSKFDSVLSVAVAIEAILSFFKVPMPPLIEGDVE